jgi:hypothetical protein
MAVDGRIRDVGTPRLNGAKVLNHEEHGDIRDQALNKEVLLDPGCAFHAKISRLRRAGHGGFICSY